LSVFVAGLLAVLALRGRAFAQGWVLWSAPIAHWSSVACSADRNPLLAAVNGGLIYNLQTFSVRIVTPNRPSVFGKFDESGQAN
jgi:hypothetical protein